MTEFSRRSLLSAGLIPIVGGLAGCADYPPGRQLIIEGLETTRTSSAWRVNLTVENQNSASNPTTDFHNVTVLGYDEDGQPVCEEHVGTVRYDARGDNSTTVSLTCDARPYLLTFQADETPCDENVAIGMAIYNESTGSWRINRYFRECGEGLPPTSSV